MNVLVTGGAGYIGAHIVDLLCDYNYTVIVFDNLSSGFKENLNNKAIFIKGNILSQQDLESVFNKFNISIIIHMAAYKSAGESMSLPDKYTKNNIIGSINVISAAIKFNVDKFVFSSTAAVYGKPKYSPVDEKHSLEPINYYGFTKLFIEQYLEWISKIQSMRFVVLRYFNAAGYTNKESLIQFKEKNPENLLPIIMEVANKSRTSLDVFGDDYKTKDGTCIRDYIHVKDLAAAHLKSLDYLFSDNDKDNLIVNLSSNVGYSVLDVIKAVEKYIGMKINYKITQRRKGDPAELISISKNALEKLNWKPKFSTIEQIIDSMWNIYKK